jgi:hypothetical protein
MPFLRGVPPQGVMAVHVSIMLKSKVRARAEHLVTSSEFFRPLSSSDIHLPRDTCRTLVHLEG